jgi:hypothetical protein
LSVHAPALLTTHRDELLNMLRNEAEVETAEHPLNRLMAIEDTEGGLLVTTTDVHLPRRLGEALRNAFQGDLQVQYPVDETSVRVAWERK